MIEVNKRTARRNMKGKKKKKCNERRQGKREGKTGGNGKYVNDRRKQNESKRNRKRKEIEEMQ